MEFITRLLSVDGVPEPISRSEEKGELLVKDKNGILPSLTMVLHQEIEKFNGLLEVVNQSLYLLKKAIKGTEIMSPDLDNVYTSLLNNNVPAMWANKAYPSLKPLSSWIKDLRNRIDFMQNWVINGNPMHYWLPGFFYPQGFLTAVRQSYARDNEVAIDKLKFDFKVNDTNIEQLTDPPEVR